MTASSPRGMQSNPITVGTYGGTPVVAQLGDGLYPDRTVSMTLNANYILAFPPGYPARPPAGNPPAYANNTILSGTTVSFLKPEADALIALGATLVGPD